MTRREMLQVSSQKIAGALPQLIGTLTGLGSMAAQIAVQPRAEAVSCFPDGTDSDRSPAPNDEKGD